MSETDAKGEDTCKTCSKEVKDNEGGILWCEQCSACFHNGCQKTSKEEYSQMKKIGKRGHWFCRECSGKFIQMKRENQDLRKENRKLKEGTELLKERIANLEERRDNLKEQLVQEINNQLVGDIQEQHERDKCKVNLVIYNLPEHEFSDEKEREESEKARCLDLFNNEIKIEVNNIVAVKRLGMSRLEETTGAAARTNDTRPSLQPRPLLVVLQDARTKWAVLKNAKNLNNTHKEIFKTVVIAPDFTPKQRKAVLKLQEPKEKKANGEQGRFIKREDEKDEEEEDRDLLFMSPPAPSPPPPTTTLDSDEDEEKEETQAKEEERPGRRKRMVDETYEDEDGYFVTKKVYKYVELTEEELKEEEEERKKEEEKRRKREEEEKKRKEEEERRREKSSPSAKNDSPTASSPQKKKRGKKDDGKKQPSIMSFFGKK